MVNNELTSGGWIKQKDLSNLNTKGEKVRVYGRPAQNLEVALNAIKSAHKNKDRKVDNLKNLEIEIQNSFYLIREGQVIRLLECKPERTANNPIFFSGIQRYVSSPATDAPLSPFFKSWFTDLRKVYSLIQSCKLSTETHQKLFFYLAHRYFYNAPFSQQENVRLGYQTSPLNITDRNSYLRSSQTIWMQLASELVYQQLSITEKAISILWIDHANFVAFLRQFYQVVEVSLLTPHMLQMPQARWLDSNKEPRRPLYIFLKDLPDEPRARLKKAKEFAEKTLKEITERLIEIENNQSLKAYFNQDPLPEILRIAALVILAKGGLGKKTDQYCTLEALNFLKKRYGKLLSEGHQQFCKTIRSSCTNGNWQDNQILFLFTLYINHPDSFPSTPVFKNPTNLQNFLKDKSTSKDFINQALTLLSAPNFLKPKDYFKAFQNDVRDNVPSSKRKAEDAVGIFYAASFEGLPALISPHGGESLHNLLTVLGNLGYSPDAVRFLRALLRGYPSFFPAHKQESFLEAVIKTKFLRLPKEMQPIASTALLNLNTLNNLDSLAFENIYSNFEAALNKLALIGNNTGWAKLYCRFLCALLNPILRTKKDLNKATLFAIMKMTDSMTMALKHRNEIHLFIRHIQDVMEAWMLYIDSKPLVEDPTQVFRDALPSKPTVVHFTPYAMRSFTRILQALVPVYSNSKTARLRIQVFNQSYFELITNMERFRETTDVIISQSDAQLEDCDVYFIDIHPNNAVEARLFSHDIPEIIKTLKTILKNRRSTFVVDITLSSLSASEVRMLLNEANPLIQSGQLNLVLVQSLTKFSQLGMDKLSAGFLAAYNTNQQIWKVFNDQLHIFQKQEPVDSLTLQFFACLTGYTPHLQKYYIEQINRNTRDLYQRVLKRYQKLNLPISKKILALTCNTDLHTCYLAFNSRGIFSLLDPCFNLSEEEISRFTSDIIKKLFIPLAEWLDLPLTERMSIGFPLSSINECMHVIRFTVGLERELLSQYADMITYICFILNREYRPQFFFESVQDQPKLTYPKRDNYFSEKVEIFKAMYPVRGKSASPVRIQEPLPDRANAHREFVLDKGTIQVVYKTLQSRYGGPIQSWKQSLNEKELYVHFAPQQDIPLTDKQITPFIKCLLASCLTQRQTQPQNGLVRNEHTINLTSVNQHWNGLINVKHLNFDNFFCIRPDNTPWNRFGYYDFSGENCRYRLSFDFKDGKFWLVLNENWFEENSIFIKKGYEILPATWLDTEEKWQLFDQASYTQLIELDFSGHRYEPDPDDFTTITLNLTDKGPRLMIERDKLVFKIDGLSLYYRKRTKDNVQLEIDFWGIKNPIHARFLSLYFCYVALYKQKIPFDFVSDSYSKVAILQRNYNPQTFHKIARKILDDREEILFQFDKKRLTQNENSVPTKPSGYSSGFRIPNSVIPYPNFMENLFLSLEFKRLTTFRDFLSSENAQQAKALKRNFAYYRQSDVAKAQKSLENFQLLMIQEIKGEAYFKLLNCRNMLMKNSGTSLAWNRAFVELLKVLEALTPPFTAAHVEAVLQLTLKLDELFEKELRVLAEKFRDPQASAQYALLSEKDRAWFAKLIGKLRHEGKCIQRPDKERQILQSVIICATNMLNAGKREESAVLRELKKTNDNIETLTLSGYPVRDYIQQFFKCQQQISDAIVKAFSAWISEGADWEHALSLVGAGRKNAFLGMEQILANLDRSLFCQPIPDDGLRRQLIDALCRLPWGTLVVPQLSEITKDSAERVQPLIDKVVLELRLHYHHVMPRGLVELDNPGGGDCLIYSYLNSHYVQNVQSSQKSDKPYKATDKEVKDLRIRMAKEITDHLDEFEGIIDRFLSDQFMTFMSKKLKIDGVRSASIDKDFEKLLGPYFAQLEDLPTISSYQKLVQKWQTAGNFRTLAKGYAEQIVSEQGKYLTSPAIEALVRVTKSPIIVEKDGVFLPFGVIYDAPPLYIRHKDEAHFVSLVLPKFAEATGMGGSISSGHQAPDRVDGAIFKDYSEKFEKLKAAYRDVCTIKGGIIIAFDAVKSEAYAKELDRLLYEMGMKEPSVKSPLLLKLGAQIAIELESLFGNDGKADPRTAFAAKSAYKDKGRFVLEMHGMTLEWNPTTAMYVLKGLDLSKDLDLLDFVFHPHAGLENYNLVCYANTALQSLTSPHFIAHLKLTGESYARLSEQSQANLQNCRKAFKSSKFKGQLHEFLTAMYGRVHEALMIIKSGEETKRAAAINVIRDILRLFDPEKEFLENLSDLQNGADQFLMKMQNEKWRENAYLADTEANRSLCLEVMQSLLTAEGAISARKLYDAIGFGAAYQDMEEFTTRLLDQIGFKQIVCRRVLEIPNAKTTTMLASETASMIQLPMRQGSVQTMIDHFFASETLEKPTQEGYTHSKIILLDAPDILPLALKRFGAHRSDEVTLDNEISITLADGQKAVYALQSVGCHLDWGHYVAGCRYEKDGQVQWLEHNDSYTSHIGTNIRHWRADPDRNAYLLIYHRQEAK
ncbi:ubiquitin carboxyl-terminal hydrolase family protein [Neochlamydia sp. AcF95]|uniref:ubiquitin carboxyl-terminal hydrolase n=1 Tax=Neochlamydia sp. AcF95 TaxID=2795734 RepID=UPI001BC9A0B2|nr:ubiquitin carboxyl-terminal hydrolase family protein [Neochlamydia sp. AcF95]MBS4169946.1 hypothetical protein [Neochlamydia sp. AcF95]